LMVFIIQNTQNRDARALHIKLDELLRAVGGARGSLADVEDRSEDELRALKDELLHECNEDETPEDHERHIAIMQALGRHRHARKGERRSSEGQHHKPSPPTSRR
ncbi:MAG: low affinity iron permease family protein, partial [Dehalococcoidia bacterium]